MKYLTNIDLNKNELQNARIQNLATDPATPGPGQIYFNTAVKKYYGYDGTSFIDLGQVLDGPAIVTLINACSSIIDDNNLSTTVGDAITKRHAHTNITTLNAIEEAFTTALKTKLDGISAAANKTTSSVTNGNIKIDGVETTVYTHPANHAASVITQDANNRFTTDAEKTAWNAKAPTTAVTTSVNGLMIAADKTKLDSVSSGANKATSSATNGNIKIDGVETTVYTHPTGTNPHGTTKSDVGLGSADNKSSATIRSEITSANVTAGLGFTPVKNGGIPELQKGAESSRPAATGSFLVYLATDTKKIWQDTASGVWTQMGGQDSVAWASLTGVPTEFNPTIATASVLGGVKIGANLSVSADGTLSGNSNPASYIIREEEFTIVGGQTTFNLVKGTYDVGRNAIEVFIDGIRFPNRMITESSGSSFAIPSGLDDGVVVFVKYMQTIAITPYPVHATQHLPGGVDVIPDVTTTSHGLMTDTDKVKLDGVATNANNYTHPAAHAPSVITQDASNRFVTDAEKATWNAKQAAGAYLTGNQTVTLSGDATGSGATSISVTLKSVGTSGVQSPKVTTDAQGRVVSSAALVATDIPTITASKVSDFDTQVRTSALNQMTAPTADVSMNSKKITSVAPPVSGTDAANKDYVDTARAGLSIKDPVRVASTVNVVIATGGLIAVDGVTLVANDRVLLKNQTAPAENGIYTAASGAWVRGAACNSSAEVVPGLAVWVNEGTTNGDSRWVLTTNGPITLGTTGLTFTKDFQASDIVAGSGMTKSGNQLDVIGTANRITANADSIDIASTYVGQTSITTVGTIGTGTWQGTDIAVADGGTGSSTASGARSNLGAAASGVNSDITSLTGLTTDLSVAQGGTGASTATAARANLGAVGKYPADIGDGVATSINVPHGLNTLDFTVFLRETVAPYNQVIADVQIVDVNNITLLFAVAPTTNQYRVIVTG